MRLKLFLSSRKRRRISLSSFWFICFFLLSQNITERIVPQRPSGGKRDYIDPYGEKRMAKFIYFTPEEKGAGAEYRPGVSAACPGRAPHSLRSRVSYPRDPSVTIRGNKWFDHSKREGGYAIRFVQR